MQVPVIPEGLAGRAGDREDAAVTQGVSLSLESQLKLRSFYEYVDSCRDTLREIERDLMLAEAEGFGRLQSATEKIEKFCIDADSWGFNELYEIALSLQMLLLNAGGRIRINGSWEAMQRGLGMLAALLEQCEREFRLRLATADTLDCINHATQE